jgi:hypothetical protein
MTVVVADVPLIIPPFTFRVPVVLAIVVDAATVFVPVPRLIVPPELVIPALIVPVQATLVPNTPLALTVTTPPFWKVVVAENVNVPVMLDVPVTVKLRAPQSSMPRVIVRAPAMVWFVPANDMFAEA